MRHFYILLISLFFTPFISSAQSNYKPGYVVKLNGDTVKGYIDYREAEKNPKSFKFKSDLKSTAENFTTATARAYAIVGFVYFEREKVSISKDKVDINSLPTGLDTTAVSDNVFLRILVKGKYLTLYQYKDFIKERFYIQDNQAGAVKELSYHLYYNPGESLSVQTFKLYKQQLQALALKFNSSSTQLSKQINDANYNREDLLKIVMIINGGGENQFIPKSLFGSRLTAGAAISDNIIYFDDNGSLPKNGSLFPKVTVGFDLIPNKTIQRVFFRLELSFTGAKHNNIYGVTNLGYVVASQEQELTFDFSLFNVAFNPQIVYDFYDTKPLKIFIDGGVSVGYSTYYGYKYTMLDFANSEPTLKHITDAPTAKVGVIINDKFEVYTSIIATSNVTDVFTTAYGHVLNYQAGVNYLFGVK